MMEIHHSGPLVPTLLQSTPPQDSSQAALIQALKRRLLIGSPLQRLLDDILLLHHEHPDIVQELKRRLAGRIEMVRFLMSCENDGIAADYVRLVAENRVLRRAVEKEADEAEGKGLVAELRRQRDRAVEEREKVVQEMSVLVELFVGKEEIGEEREDVVVMMAGRNDEPSMNPGNTNKHGRRKPKDPSYKPPKNADSDSDSDPGEIAPENTQRSSATPSKKKKKSPAKDSAYARERLASLRARLQALQKNPAELPQFESPSGGIPLELFDTQTLLRRDPATTTKSTVDPQVQILVKSANALQAALQNLLQNKGNIESDVWRYMARVQSAAANAEAQYKLLVAAYSTRDTVIKSEVPQILETIEAVEQCFVENDIDAKVISNDLLQEIVGLRSQLEFEKQKQQYDAVRDQQYLELHERFQDQEQIIIGLREHIDELNAEEEGQKDQRIEEREVLISTLKYNNSALEETVTKLRGTNHAPPAPISFHLQDLVEQVDVPILDTPDAVFANQWQDLHTDILNVLLAGYSSVLAPGFKSRAPSDDHLLRIYHTGVVQPRVPWSPKVMTVNNKEVRNYYVMGVIYQILHEEVFQYFRSFATINASDPQLSWLEKSSSGEGGDGPNNHRKRLINEVYDAYEPEYKRLQIHKKEATATVLLQVNTAIKPEDAHKLNVAQQNPDKTLQVPYISEWDQNPHGKTPNEVEPELNTFHLTRAKLLKTLATAPSEPLRAHLQSRRAHITTLILTTLEPLRLRKSQGHDHALPCEALKHAIHGIVGKAVDLAILLRCQRASWRTWMPEALGTGKYLYFDPATMENVPRDGPMSDPEVQRFFKRHSGPGSAVGAVRIVARPALVRVGRTKGASEGMDYSKVDYVVKAAVVTNVGSVKEMQKWLDYAKEIKGTK